MINYYLITKPGIVFGNLVTFAAGFLLASHGAFYPVLFFTTLLGLAFVMASACVFNNFIDRKLDRKMARTKRRALVTGLISKRQALSFATALGALGAVILLVATNLLTVVVAAIGFFVYVVLYSMWKSRTIFGTAIGSVAGAIPPVVGYCAVSHQFDLGAFILFAMLVLWQMPHFFAVAMVHLDDYTAAKIPVLPVVKGIWRTKIHMIIYIIAFLITAGFLTYFNYTGYAYLIVTTFVTGGWLLMCFKGLSLENNERRWSTQMFQLSLVLILAVCIMMSIDHPSPS